MRSWDDPAVRKRVAMLESVFLEVVKTFAVVAIIAISVAVIVPLTLVMLFVRQVRRGWRRRAHRRPVARLSAPAPAAGPGAGMGRPWAVLVGDACAARERYRRVVEDCRPGPLRDSLAAAMAEVDAAVAEAHRLADQ